MYYKYFKYILEHKRNVFIECINMAKEYWNKNAFKKDNKKIARQLFIHAFTHDLSKFKPSEFIPYARYFFNDYKGFGSNFNKYEKHTEEEYEYQEKLKIDFEKAWEYHYKHNKHHPEHWVNKDIPAKYIRQMVCDLKAMSRKFGGTAQEYYLKNYYKWDITRETRFRLEIELDLITKFNAPICDCNEEYWMTIEELIKYNEEWFKRNGEIRLGTVKENINDLLKPACDKYNVNIYELVKGSKILHKL